jgi:beta-lactamase regulating signal transducer with metallopeptidase domain
MILRYISATWPTVASAFGNHLWQSTLFAILAGVLTLVLRNNHARVRYAVWLVASLKFLIPFALLVGLGSQLASLRGSAGAQIRFSVVLRQIGDPFTPQSISVIHQAAPSNVSPNLIHQVPALLTGVWLCGFVLILILWSARWRRLSSALHGAVPMREGREVETLRRLEKTNGMPKQIEMRLSQTSLEPGIFGLSKPVLVWPDGISTRLSDAHLEAILAHELWHVRRHDNLAAVTHMVVEAIFWFHPLAWWLGSRLVEERERACDEAVLEFGSDRRIYAEGILKICDFCVGSPLTFVSGVTGADLKGRIARIMTDRVGRSLDFSRKLLLSTTGLLAVAAPIAFGIASNTTGEAGEVVARVNNEIITKSELDKARISAEGGARQDCKNRCTPEQLQIAIKDRQNNTLRDLIDESLLVQRGREMGVSVEADVAKQLDQIRIQYNLPDLAALEKTVTAQGINWDEFKTNIRNGLLVQMVVTKEIASHIKITREEAMKYYDEHKSEFEPPEGMQSFEKVEPEIMDHLYGEHMEPALRDYLNTLREQAHIVVKPGYQWQ